jgi:TRAP-type C4-dicarboxylate transport system substrate-binding protein
MRPMLRARTFAACLLSGIVLLQGCGPSAGTAEEFRVVGSSPPGTPWSNQWLRFEESLASDPTLGLKPALYVQAQLGDSERTIQSLRRGRVQLGGFPLAAAASLVPEMALLQAPFLFGSEQEVDHVVDRFLQEPLNALFEAQGVTVLAWTEAGWDHLFSTVPIEGPDDLAGFPVRAQPTPASRILFGELGADVKPLPYSELLSALQTGLVRGGDGNTVLYLAGGIAREAPHLTLTAHVFEVGVILANRDWWRSLSESQRRAVRNALGPRARLRAEVADLSARLLAQAVQAGTVQVRQPSPVEIAAWREATAGVRARLVEEIGGDARRIDGLIEAGRRDFAERSPAG